MTLKEFRELTKDMEEETIILTLIDRVSSLNVQFIEGPISDPANKTTPKRIILHPKWTYNLEEK